MVGCCLVDCYTEMIMVVSVAVRLVVVGCRLVVVDYYCHLVYCCIVMIMGVAGLLPFG